MPLTLMYITNHPEVALCAQNAGIDRIFIDLEFIGKEVRQAGRNTVKSHHTFKDIQSVRAVLRSAELLVRVNPIHEPLKGYCGSEEEIDTAIACGADILMLPMFRTRQEVERFIVRVNRRAKVLLLAETPEAVENLDDILAVEGIDEVHIGLNDLHLAYGKQFMFELLADGTVDDLCRRIAARGIRYGFGGIARIGRGLLPAEFIIGEHYRLGSKIVILSRSFCDVNEIPDIEQIGALFIKGVRDIRDYEERACRFTPIAYEENRQELIRLVERIVSGQQTGTPEKGD